MIIYYCGSFLTILGVFLLFTGTLGIIRFPDFFSRLHAASLSDSFGAPFTLIGLEFLMGVSSATIKIIILIAILLITSTTTEYVISAAKLKDLE